MVYKISFTVLGRTFLILLLFGYSVLPIHYLASYLFTVPATGFEKMQLFAMCTGFFLVIVGQILSNEQMNLKSVMDVLNWVFILFPHYCLFLAFQNHFTAWSIYNSCSKVVESCAMIGNTLQDCWNKVCGYTPQCCSKYYYY